ncbi:hypothetical protein B296_00001240 [Ensete ventricosum]|uniref:Uncharacterized protein n=1 Tax=Ensete ventricosum TaxID=4639 RepID=A0A427BA51_ENSVE|nr:hypothetical protein B296_00001240 [Ensete ventricosum]
MARPLVGVTNYSKGPYRGGCTRPRSLARVVARGQATRGSRPRQGLLPTGQAALIGVTPAELSPSGTMPTYKGDRLRAVAVAHRQGQPSPA